METLIQLLLSKQELQQPKQQKKAKVTVPDKKQMLPIHITTRIEISSHCSAKTYYKKRGTLHWTHSHFWVKSAWNTPILNGSSCHHFHRKINLKSIFRLGPLQPQTALQVELWWYSRMKSKSSLSPSPLECSQEAQQKTG